jgi:glycosyltransferase involved in cell wall biosynthesis
VVRLCESLIAEKHEVKLAALDWAPLSKTPKFVKTFPLGFGPSRLGRSPEMSRWLTEYCALGQVDVLHNHGMWQMNAIYPAKAAMRGNVHLVFSPHGAFSEWAMQHGSLAKRFFWPLLQRPALKRATCFHATAESEYHDIRRLGFKQPVAIIPNGIDLPTITSSKAKRNQRTLLFLGRVHVVKGLDMLLPAWRSVQDSFPDWRLVIAGGDDGYNGVSGYLDEVKGIALQLGLNRVEFPGPLYGEDKWQAYRDADLYVLPSYSENFGMTVAEALVMGTPAIVSKGAPWSGLELEGAGWWTPIGVEPLVASLKDAMSQPPSVLYEMGECGRRWMQKDFTWNSIGYKMSSTYEWLCDRSLPVPPWVRID